MKFPLPEGLYLIIDHDLLAERSPEAVATEAIGAGVRTIQYRAKNLSKNEAYVFAERIRAVCDVHGVSLIINDLPDLALAIDAQGVHLGQDDLPVEKARKILGPGRIIGISAHTVSQAQEAAHSGADYLGVGPVYSSKTKQTRSPIGCKVLREIRESVNIPVVGIGGITPENVREVMDSGAKAYAVVSAVLSAENMVPAIRSFHVIHPDGVGGSGEN